MSTTTTLVAIVALCLVHGSIGANQDVIMEPTKSTGTVIALVHMQGAQISTAAYIPFMKEVQKASDFQLWVGIPSYPLNLVNPLVIGGGITRILKEMQSHGLPADAPVFYSGHSLGGAMLQSYLNTSTTAKGQILMGAFIQRKYNDYAYPVETLTMGGTLDGLCRTSRLAEGYAEYFELSPRPNGMRDFPYIAISGMNHMQWASGTPPTLVKDHDLQAEISDSQAWALGSSYLASFISVQMGGSGQSVITPAVQWSAQFWTPLITGMREEGSYHFWTPCNNGPVSSACMKGSPWTPRSQTIMAGLPQTKLNIADRFHKVYDIPVHLPNITNTCKQPQGCTLDMNTVTQNVYSQLDELDTGYAPVSAVEIRTKMKSRQAVWTAAGIPNVNFTQTDGGNICEDINSQTYQWAIQNCGSATLARYQKYGEPYTFGPDIQEGAGPLWIWHQLVYDNSSHVDVEIKSPMMRTPINYPIPLARGFHYCKVLSPARALEWMYVDGLRMHLGTGHLP